MIKPPDQHTETLTPWTKSLLGRGQFPKQKFHIDEAAIMEAAPPSTTPKEVQTEIAEATTAIREILAQIGLPAEIAGNHLYENFLIHDFPAEGEPIPSSHPINARRNILPLAPFHSKPEKVEERIDLIAQKIFEHMVAQNAIAGRPQITGPKREKALTAIKNAVYLLLDQNLRRLDNTPIVNIDPQGEKRLSTRQIRKAVRNTRQRSTKGTQKTQPGDKDLDLLLLEFGILENLPAGEFHDHEPLLRALTSARNNAHRFYEEFIGKSLVEAQRKFRIPGERVKVDVDEENKAKSFFELLDTAISEPEGESDFSRINEAQTLAYLTYQFFLIKINEAYRGARDILGQTRKQILEGLFAEQKAAKSAVLYIDQKENVVPYKTDSYTTYELRKLEIKGFEDLGEQFAYYTGWDTKKADSILAKLMERPERRIEDLPDLLRGSVVAWGIGKKEIDHPDLEKRARYRDYLSAIGHQVGASLGLTLNDNTTDYHKLNPGEFMIDAGKLDTNPNPKSYSYRVVKLYGRTQEGVPVEFQILPKTTYEDKLSQQSPTNDKYYQWEKAVKLAPLCYAESINPRIHEVAKQVAQAMQHSKDTMAGQLAKTREQSPSAKKEALLQEKIRQRRKRHGRR